jgi:hypothetical protein
MTLRRMSFVAGGLLFVAGLGLPLISCGGGGGAGGGGGVDHDYGIMLTPASTMVAPGGTINLNVHYDAPANNLGITWSVGCGQADCGSVSSSGIYTAPAKADLQIPVGIRATSNDKPTMSYYVEIWVTGPIKITMSPDWTIGVVVGTTQQFTAAVNSPDTAVIWQVNGTVGGNSTIGTITTAGLYTAPAAVPSPATVTVTAVAHCDQSATVSKQVTIMMPPPVTVQISPRDQNVNVGATLQFTAAVQNTNDTVVQWKVNGIAGGNSTVGTISSSGLFTAPAAVPSPALETITAVSHADSTKSDSTFVTIVNLHNAVLNGAYAFEISGPDSNGHMRAGIGYISFDGNGNLIGIMDANSVIASAAQTQLQFAGTYTVGTDYRSKMTFNISPALSFAFTLNATGNNAKLIEWDGRGTYYTGLLQKATTSDFWIAKFTGDYAFSSYGSTMANERQVAIGRFHADGAGGITAAAIDAREAGQALDTLSNLTGSFNVSDNTHGRGTFSLTQSGSEAANFSFYMTNAGDIFFMSTDPVPSDNPLLVGRILSQTGAPFSNTALDGASVMGIAGIGASSALNSCLSVGQWTAISSSQTLSGTWDLICDGNVTQGMSLGASYSIDSNGRGTFAGSTMPVDVFYVVSKNKILVMQSSGSSLMIGMAEPQQVSTFNNSLFSGTYRIGPISMAQPGGGMSQGYIVADGAGNFTATEDVFDDGLVSLTMSGTDSVATNGRTLVTVTSPELFHYVAYPVSATRFIGMSIETSDYEANLTSLDQ